MVESSQIFKFLVGLNVEFDEVRGRIIGWQPLPSLGEVFSEVRCEESRRNVMLGKKLSGPVENSALLGTATTTSSNPNNQRRSDDKPRVWCDHCNKPCHTHETCWKLHGKPTDWKLVEWKTNKQGNSNHFLAKTHATETPSLSKEQLDQLLQLLKPAPLTPGTPIASLTQSGSLSCAYSLLLSAPWIINSGTSDHMTNLSYLFMSYTPCYENKKARIANGSLSSIVGQGSIRLSDKIVLQSVLHVPKLS